VLFVFADDRNATEVIRSLLKQGAAPNAANDKGWTSLMVAASNGRVKNVQALLEGGASRSAKNRAGETALDLARKEKIDAVVEVLVASSKVTNPRPPR
jgi:ankyrin repeat protein